MTDKPQPDNIIRFPTPTTENEPLYRFSQADNRNSPYWKPFKATFPRFCEEVGRIEIGPKEAGGCIAPAVFENGERSKMTASEVSIIPLDYDCGYGEDVLRSALEATGLRCVYHSTASHLKKTTEVRRGHFESWKIIKQTASLVSGAETPPNDDLNEWMRLFLLENGNMLPEIVQSGVQVVRAFKKKEKVKEALDGQWVWAERRTEMYEVQHLPIPRWRVYIPLVKPWKVSDYESRRAALTDYSELYLRIVDEVGLRADESCKTPDRLLYKRRVATQEALALAVVVRLEGSLADPWEMNAALKRVRARRPQRLYTERGLPGDDTEVDAFGQNTGERVLWDSGDGKPPFDLTEWLAKHGRHFQIVDALLDRGQVVCDERGNESGHEHILCPFESTHSPTMGGCFTRNGDEGGGFAVTCIHNGCSTRTRIDFVGEFLNQGALDLADLTDPRYNLNGGFDVLDSEDGEAEEVPVADEEEDNPFAELDAELAAFDSGETGVEQAPSSEADLLAELDALLAEDEAAPAADPDADAGGAADNIDVSLFARRIIAKVALLDKEEMCKSLSTLKEDRPSKFEELKDLCAAGGIKKKALNDAALRGKKLNAKASRPKVSRAPHIKVIRYVEAHLVDHVDDVEAIIVADPDSGVVCSYSDSASTIRIAAPKTVQQLDGSAFPPMPLVYQFSHAAFRERIMRSCAFVIGTGDEERGIKCPDDIVQTLLSRNGHGMPPLTGIVEAPTPRPDGSLLSVPGYDAATGLYALFDTKILDGFRMKPTLKDAQAAYAFLRDEMFKGFPFVTELDKSIAAAAFLTSLVRRVIDAAPAFAFDAPIYSSGKSALVGVIAQACTGRPAAGTTWPTGEHAEEAVGKKLTSILREGHNLIFFDNVPEGTVLDSATLSAILTLPTYEERILGVTQMLTVPTTVTMIFTGNNIRAGDDMATRLLKSRLDPKEERPDQRTFTRPDLTVWVSENRTQCVQAALTIMLHQAQSGFKVASGLKPSRFKAWDKWVRFSLVTAGAEDPGAGFDASVAGDVKRQALAEAFAQWHAVFGNKAYKAREIVSKINGAVDVAERTAKDTAGKAVAREGFDEQPGAECSAQPVPEPTEAQAAQECLENLAEALQELFGSVRGGTLTPKGFSRAMAKFNGREIGGYRLECVVDVRTNIQAWRVDKIKK